MKTSDLFLAPSSGHVAGHTDALSVPAWSIWCELRHLESVYPSFNRWYWDAVVPETSSGRRRIFVSTDNGQISGITIAKKEIEKKICTVWVSPEFRERAVARGLMEDAIAWLGTSKPLFTVPDGRMREFSRLVNYFEFERGDLAVDFYGRGRIEHTFNGSLSSPIQA